MKSSTAIVALLVAAIAAAPALPAAAQQYVAPDGSQIGLSLDAGAPSPDDLLAARFGGPGRSGMDGMGPGMGMGRGMGMMMLACSDRGAEALDVALLHLSYRLQLTAEQKPLFDAFREKALTTETSFADTCKANAPAAASGDAKPDLLAGIKSGLAIEQARLTAFNDVLPSFEALYNSLTDTQKQALIPQHDGWRRGMQRPGDMGRSERPAAPGR